MSESLKEVAQSLKEVIEWVIKKKFLAGEMYDLTASSFKGLEGFETGKIKNDYGLLDGISESLYKYKKELAIILKDETDDKFAKRREINYMIDHCLTCDENITKMITEEIFDKQWGDDWKLIKEKPASFDELFKFTTNYLNGKNGTDQFNNQCLIVTVAGGNPIKIFFQILAYLYNKGQSVNIDDLITKFYKGINHDEDASEKATLIKILTNLKNFFNLTLSEEHIKSIKDKRLNTLATEVDLSLFSLKMDLKDRITGDLKFSDMDFAILPNKETIIDSYISKQEEEQLGGVGRQTAKVAPEVPPPVRAKRDRGKSITDQRKEEAAIETAKVQKKEEESKKRKQDKKEAEKQAAKEAKEAEKQATKEAKVVEKEAKRIKTEEKQDKPPPKGPGSASSQAGPSGEHKEEKSHGFLLVRLKSSNQFLESYEGLTPTIKRILIEMNRLSKMIHHFPPSKKEQACAKREDLKKLGQSLLFLAQPQLFRQSYLKVDGLSDDCRTFLQYKKEEKNLIGKLTSMNITTFVDYISKDSQAPEDRLEAFMDFLHENGKLQNVLIEKLSENQKYSSKKEVLDNFQSIEAICDTEKYPLYEIMSELVLEFSQRPVVNAVMEKITQNLNQDVNSKNIDPTKNTSFKSKTCFYSPVYLAQHLAHKLDIKNKLHTINDAPPGLYKLPNNSKITTNPTYKPTNLESRRIQTPEEEKELKALEDEIDNYIAAGIIDDELEEEIEKELIPGLSKLSIGEGRKRHKTRKKRNKKSKKKTRKKRKKKNKISRRKRYTKKNKKG
jgi:hypothetical protein